MPKYKTNPLRRPRQSSSESDCDLFRPTPKRVNTKTYSKPILTLENTLSRKDADRNVSTNDLYALMHEIKQNQNSLRMSLEQRITNLESEFACEINKSMINLKEEMTLEFAKIENRFKTLEDKMMKYESE